MYQRQTRTMTKRELDETIERQFRDIISAQQLAQLGTDIRVRTMFEVDLEGRGLTFAHFAFRDFLAGSALAAHILGPSRKDSSLDGLPLNTDVLASIQFNISRLDAESRLLSRFKKTKSGPQPHRTYKGDLAWCWVAARAGCHRSSWRRPQSSETVVRRPRILGQQVSDHDRRFTREESLRFASARIVGASGRPC